MGKIRNNKMTYLYLIEMTSINGDEKFYKIGVANKGVYVRYFYDKKLRYNIKILVEVLMDTNTALKYENFIKEAYFTYLYHPKYHFGGSKTECFSVCPQLTMDTRIVDNIFSNKTDRTFDVQKIIPNINFFYINNMPTRFYDLVETNKKQAFTLTNIKQYPNAYNYILTMLVRPTARFNLEDYEDKSFNIVGSNELNSLLNVKGSIKSINPIRDDLLSNRIFLIESFIYTGYKGDDIKNILLTTNY